MAITPENTVALPVKVDSLEEKFAKAKQRYQKQPDPFGLSVDKFATSFKILYPIYESYFKVRLFGEENLQGLQNPRMFVSNHTGQIPFDGILLTIAAFMHSQPWPVILRGLGERFLMGLPFLGKVALENGVILGDRKNCEICLTRGESVLTFPEGVRGISKSTAHFYRTQKFSLGFARMALQCKVPIQPVAIVGAEEMYPFVWQAPKLAKLLKLPSFPITPFFPWLGAFGMIPLPSPVDIYILPPVELPKHLHAGLTDEDLLPFAKSLHGLIQETIDEGRKHQRPMVDFKKIGEQLGGEEFWREKFQQLWKSYGRG